jgi:hypothetical protein
MSFFAPWSRGESFNFIWLLVICALQSGAHMRMSEPPPLCSPEEGVNVTANQDNPLAYSGLGFPCQNTHRDAGHQPVKNWTAGEFVAIK